MARGSQIRIGTSGWIYRHWRGVFYPEDMPVRRWFAYYSASFDTVEVNNTFYRLPAAEVFDQWQKQAPPGFVYALKASRYLTHQKKLHDPAESLQNILGRARRLGRRMGPVLYQLPPRWHCDLERLRRFIALLPRDLLQAFEFRDLSWYNDAVRALLTEAGMGFCIHDLRGVSSPVWTTGKLVYIRFHGPTEKPYAACYPLAHLRRWAKTIREFHENGHDVFVYFNNDDAGYALKNAQELKGLLGIATPRHDTAKKGLKQATLWPT
ncbi:MAG: DUF72 domain-containing protein [Gemmataceae bacterium]